MGVANADDQGVYLWELEGAERRVQFIGSDTPRRGVSVAAEIRSVTTHYPGSSVPSTQLLGFKEDEIPFEGTFRDDLYGLSGHALAQRDALVGLMRGQRYCQLNWGQALVKRGHVRRVEYTVHAEGWIDYRFVFEVSESDEEAVGEAPYPAAETPFDLLALLREIASAAEQVAQTAVLVNNVAHAVT